MEKKNNNTSSLDIPFDIQNAGRSATESQTDQSQKDESTRWPELEPLKHDIEMISTKTIPDLRKRLDESQIKYTEILGVFVALFTFVSINIQVFSQVTSLRNALVFIILIFLCLAGFLYIMDMILSQNSIDRKNKRFGLIVMISSALITVLLLVQEFIPLSTERTKEIDEINNRLIEIEAKQEMIMQDRVTK